MERVGVVGGTFDPIHLAHVYIAYEAKETLALDKVIFMPAGSPPHKRGKEITKASLRYAMVEAAIDGYKDFSVSDYEINKQGLSYTYQTLEYLKSEDIELFFITGADCLMDLDKWVEVKKIFSLAKLVVFSRPGFNIDDLEEQKKSIEKKYNGEVIFLPVDNLEISSTKIRKRLKEGKRVDFFLDSKVLEIIEKEGLYKDGGN